jgi:hypothetical protein
VRARNRFAGSQRTNRSYDGVARLVRALDALLMANPGADAAIALGGEIWLDDAAQT